MFRFEIKNLMRANEKLPRPMLSAVIEHDLFHRPARICAGDVIEFN